MIVIINDVTLHKSRAACTIHYTEKVVIGTLRSQRDGSPFDLLIPNDTAYNINCIQSLIVELGYYCVILETSKTSKFLLRRVT